MSVLQPQGTDQSDSLLHLNRETEEQALRAESHDSRALKKGLWTSVAEAMELRSSPMGAWLFNFLLGSMKDICTLMFNSHLLEQGRV